MLIQNKKKSPKKVTGVEQGMQQRTTKAECTKSTTSHKEKKANNIQIKMEPKTTIAHNPKTDNTQNKNKNKNENHSVVKLNLNSNLNKRTDNVETEVRPRKKQNIAQSGGIEIEKSNLEISEKQFKKRKQSNTEKQDEQ